MVNIEIPTVTEADLLQYHACHFDAPFPHEKLMLHASPEPVATDYDYEYDADDDQLGYYADGAKRTLTDQQVAMFRHTEIQTILRERRERAEQEARSRSRTHSATPAPSAPWSVNEKITKGSGKAEDSDEEEYARFLAAERQEFQIMAAKKRNGERTIYDPQDRTISTRRKVREMDSMQTSNAVLMYDDEPTDAKKMEPTVEVQREKQPNGRKIWFPLIG